MNTEYEHLRLNNTGFFLIGKKTSVEGMNYFVFGLDKMSIYVEHNGNIRIIAPTNKKKHGFFSR